MKNILMVLLILAVLLPCSAQAKTETEAIHKMEKDVLQRLYDEKPETRREIESAVGYAVFSSGELAIVWLSAGYGHGLAHDNRVSQDVYMQMAKAGVGLGIGAKDYNVVFVFNDADSFHTFTTVGLDLTGTLDAAASAGEKGASVSGAADVLPGVRVYQMTDTGLMAQAMLQGTKFWRDDALNTDMTIGENYAGEGDKK
jgi:lipid-binding SYLF domain-containing protein